MMNRRDFLRMAAWAGLTVASPLGRALAKGGPAGDDLLWVLVHAGGGWDPTSLCDPKGRETELDDNPVNLYFTDDIGEAGNLRYAPVGGNAAFFDKHYKKVLVVNGVDTATNSHDGGTRNTWSGKLVEGYPAFGALVAATVAADKPLAFVSNGGYDETAGLVAPTRVGNPALLTKLAWPNRVDPSKPDETFFGSAAAKHLDAARRDRLKRLVDEPALPREHAARSLLWMAREGGSELKLLEEALPKELDQSGNELKRQAQLAVATFKAGLSVAASLSTGGFDTHGNHDASHYPRLQALLEGVDFLLEEAERQGVADRLVVVVGSDFGRTPHYNDGMGKDHWSITSTMLMGPGIPGNRVVGTTDAGHVPIPVDPKSLAPDAKKGVRITPEHIHKALRGLAGITGQELELRFPLSIDPLPLFG